MQKTEQLPKIKTLDVVLILLGVFLLLFTVAMVVVFVKFQAVPDTLITSVFACCGAEGGFMALIQTTKIKEKEEETDGGND